MSEFQTSLLPARQNYLTVKQAVQRYPAVFPTESAVRNIIFKADDRHFSKGVIKGNGLSMAILRVGRKVLLDEAKLVQWIESHRTGGSCNV